jgi:response regulator RpfG family c-di-GMP phosphodiesterase
VDSTREALRTLEEHPVDIILSDHKMPGMTGLQFLACTAKRWPDTLRFLITGWTASIPEREIRALGIRAVIPKPWDDTALKEILRKAVKDLGGLGFSECRSDCSEISPALAVYLFEGRRLRYSRSVFCVFLAPMASTRKPPRSLRA